MKINLDKKTVTLMDDVTIDVNFMASEDYQKIFRIFTSQGIDNDDSSKMIANEELLNVGREIIPKYCSNLKGVQVEECGKCRDANVDDLVNIGGLLQFVPLTLAQLFSASSMTQTDKEDLKKQSAAL